MINIGANGNKIAYGIKHYNLDTETDLNKLDTFYLTPGTTAFIIDTSESYMLNGEKKWIKIKSPISGGNNGGGDSGGGGGDNDTPDSDNVIIYDGGTPIESYDVIVYNGGTP